MIREHFNVIMSFGSVDFMVQEMIIRELIDQFFSVSYYLRHAWIEPAHMNLAQSSKTWYFQ